MAYTKTQWNPGGPPGISAENLNKIEQGIADAHDKVDTALTVVGEVAEELAAHKNENATQDKYGHIRLSDIPKPYVHDSVTGENWQWKMENGIVFLEKVVE